MSRRILVPLLLLFACAPAVAQETILDCPFNDIGGDLVRRGWYVPDYPSDRLDLVELQFYAFVSGDFTVTLTAREATYDGPVIGVRTIDVGVTEPFSITEGWAGADSGSGEYLGDTFRGRGVFDFGAVSVPENATLTFAFDIPPDAPSLFFDAGPCLDDSNCDTCGHAVIETEGTEPPLDTFRRASVGVIFAEGGDVPALGAGGLVILAGLLLLLPAVLRRLG